MNKTILHRASLQYVAMLFLCLPATSSSFGSTTHFTKIPFASNGKLAVFSQFDNHNLRIKFNAVDQVPIVTADEAYFCSGSNLLLTASAAETYQWYKDGLLIDGATAQTYSVNQSGTYTIYATYGEGPSGLSAGFKVSQGNIWLGTASNNEWSDPLNWSCGVVPTESDDLVIAQSTGFPIISDESMVTVKGMLLETDAKLVVESGSTLKVINAIDVAESAEIIFENSASLLQVNDVSNIGKVTFQKTTAAMKKYDYTYWSAPVSGQTLHNLSPNTLADKYYSFSPTIGNWVSHLNGTIEMGQGVGYIIRAPQSFSATLATAYTDGRFTGTPNNGSITVPIVIGNSDMNLIGNPYPSAIDIDLFLQNSNNIAITGGTVYLWTHYSAPAEISGDNTYNYTSNDYASYNQMGGVKSGNGVVPTGKIASGQGFFIQGITNGDAIFDNSMRVAFSNNQFFKNENSNTVENLEKHRLWINLSNNQGAFKQTLVGFVAGATDETDRNFDGIDFNGNTFVNLYTIANEQHYNIQGRALPFDENYTIPLGYSTTIAGTFKINLDGFDGIFESQNVYLLDNTDGTLFDLKSSDYEFSTSVGTFNNRFELRFVNPTVLSTQNFDGSSIVLAAANGALNIKSSEVVNAVGIYDLTGRLIFEKRNLNIKEVIVNDLNSTVNTIVFVRIKFTNGKIIIKKAMLE